MYGLFADGCGVFGTPSYKEKAVTSESARPGIGPRVRAARERLGWTREALAFRSGVSWPGIAQIEAGRRTNLRPATLAALAGALGVTTDYLVLGGPAGSPMLVHEALLYRSDDELVGTAAPFLAEGVERSEAALAITSTANIELLRMTLGPAAEHVDFFDSAAFLTDPRTVLDRFRAFSTAKLEGGAPWVRILGEPVWIGRSDPEIREWTRFESLLNLVFAAWPVSMLCPYDERSLAPEIVREACVTHPHTIGRTKAAGGNRYTDPGAFALEPDP